MGRPVLLKHQLYIRGRQNAMRMCGMWFKQYEHQCESFTLYQWIRPTAELGEARNRTQKSEICFSFILNWAAESPLHHAFLNGPSGCHLSRSPACMDKWLLYLGSCFGIYWQVCTKSGKAGWKLGRGQSFWPHYIRPDLT